MPTYGYVCGQCGHEFDEFQSITAKPLRKCPQCGKSSLKRLNGLQQILHAFLLLCQTAQPGLKLSQGRLPFRFKQSRRFLQLGFKSLLQDQPLTNALVNVTWSKLPTAKSI